MKWHASFCESLHKYKKDTGFPVDPIQINAMVDNIKALKITALVSESKDYGRYDLNEERKIKVTAFSQDKSVRSFDLGKTASSYRHTFIRIDNDPRVFHAEQNFREAFEKSENDLLDRKILSLDSESVSRIEGTVEGVVYGFEKKKAVESNGTESKQAETEKMDQRSQNPIIPGSVHMGNPRMSPRYPVY